MLKHWKYLKYILRHKKYVYREGRKLGLSRWQLFWHDWTKFLPSEWFAYVNFFYGGKKVENYVEEARKDPDFEFAWNCHQKRNKHHWQWWVKMDDSGLLTIIPMQDKHRREMYADWKGAGRAQGKSDIWSWYETNKEKMILHPETRMWIEAQLVAEEWERDLVASIWTSDPTTSSKVCTFTGLEHLIEKGKVKDIQEDKSR